MGLERRRFLHLTAATAALSVLPEMLDVFIAEVVPLLQRRGLFRTAYEGETLRSHFGLTRPPVRMGA